jgi:hypothetical protein
MRACAVLPYLAFVLALSATAPCQASDAARGRAEAIAARVGTSWGDALLGADEAPAPSVPAPAAVVEPRPVAPPVDALTPDELVRQIKLVKFQLAQLEASWTPGAISPTYEGAVRNLRRRLKRLYARLGTLVATGPGL